MSQSSWGAPESLPRQSHPHPSIPTEGATARSGVLARMPVTMGEPLEPQARDLDRMMLAARGDPGAQAWLLAEVTPRVRGVTRAFLENPADADDAAQLALLAVLKSAPTYRGEASLPVWAKRIAVRTTLRFLRGERRRASAPSASGEVDELPAPISERGSEALARDVREYLAELPEAQRNAIILHHALGYSVDEIAALTEVSPDTVKGRLKLGTAALRKRVRQEIAIGRRRQV